MSERLRQGLQQRNKREKKIQTPEGKDQPEREELLPTRSLREGTASAPAAPGCQENRPAEAEATPEGEGSKPKRQTADRGQSRLGEPGSRPTAKGAQRREPRNHPKTHSLREVHPERGHKRLQGAKLSNRPRHQPQPAEKRVGYERPPQTSSKDRGGNT